jgi:hypothetical protein
LGLDKAVPHARLQTVTKAQKENKRNESIVEKNNSEKRVRINETTTNKDNQPVTNVPLFDDEWEREGKTNLPTKEMQTIGNRVIFIKTGMWNGSS